jgi:hypothetical protein
MDTTKNKVGISELRAISQHLLEACDMFAVYDFTYSLINLVWADMCLHSKESLEYDEVVAMLEEVDQSIEIMNPELKKDLELLNSLRDALENAKKYLEN